MNKPLSLTITLIVGATLAHAGNKTQTGTIISENSVACGSSVEKGKKNKQVTTDVLCQEYVVRTGGIDYHVRQMKPSEKPLIPINTPIEFTLDKDKIRFKANGKSYEYLVVSEAAAPNSPNQSADATKP